MADASLTMFDTQPAAAAPAGSPVVVAQAKAGASGQDSDTRPASPPLSAAELSDAIFSQSWNCPLCRAADAAPVWRNLPPRSTGGGPSEFRLCQCRECELVFTVPQLTGEQVGPYYPARYYGHKNARFNPIMERLTRWLGSGRANGVARLQPRPGRVLDIGCGRGMTLARLRELGWETEGVELSETSALHAKEKLGLNVTVGPFEPGKYPDGHFDAIVIWHVLEHVINLDETLRGIQRILKPGGVLALAVPNRASWQAQVAKYDWFHLDMPRHYWHFSADWLIKKLGSLGFEIKRQNYASFEQNPYGWVQGILNRLGLPYNLMYDLLRSPSARSVPDAWRRYPWQSLVSVLGLAALGPLAVAMLVPEALFRRGGSVELYAVKK
ncbi:MAG: class I SAM-dependent methyltransferase [Planctomycetes bacterium]|nr:class I SAM-dependent methyltransferase [Planctomycetota bacterium]